MLLILPEQCMTVKPETTFVEPVLFFRILSRDVEWNERAQHLLRRLLCPVLEGAGLPGSSAVLLSAARRGPLQKGGLAPPPVLLHVLVAMLVAVLPNSAGGAAEVTPAAGRASGSASAALWAAETASMPEGTNDGGPSGFDGIAASGAAWAWTEGTLVCAAAVTGSAQLARVALPVMMGLCAPLEC